MVQVIILLMVITFMDQNIASHLKKDYVIMQKNVIHCRRLLLLIHLVVALVVVLV